MITNIVAVDISHLLHFYHFCYFAGHLMTCSWHVMCDSILVSSTGHFKYLWSTTNTNLLIPTGMITYKLHNELLNILSIVCVSVVFIEDWFSLYALREIQASSTKNP